MKKQIKHVKNEDVVLTIDGMNHEGMGVARLDGMAVFVQGALKGERVKAKLIKVAATYAIARVVELEETSPERKEPFCPVYRRCGGCSLQHMTYAESLRFKHQVVVGQYGTLGRVQGDRGQAGLLHGSSVSVPEQGAVSDRHGREADSGRILFTPHP